MYCRQRRQHTDSGGYHLTDDIINHTDINIKNRKRLSIPTLSSSSRPWFDSARIDVYSRVLQYWLQYWRRYTQDHIWITHHLTFSSLYFYYFIYFVSQTNYLLTHIFSQNTHTHTHTHTHIYIYTNVVSIDNLILFVALLWRAGRVLYEGLTRWLRYCLDREIDQ